MEQEPMNFDNEKYEYLLHTWGGFYNEEHKKIHGKSEGSFFFDSMDQLTSYLNELREIEEKLGAKYLASVIYEGKSVRYKTIAEMKMKLNDKVYDYSEDFGYGYSPESARYMFFDGNYSCDCNKSAFLNSKYGDEVPIMDCGDEIEIVEFNISYVK